MVRKIFLFVLLIPLQLKADSTQGWFSPSLSVNEHQICSEFEDSVRQKFLSADRGLLPDKFGTNTEEAVLTVEGQTIYLGTRRYGGCGGACERYSITASLQGNPNNANVRRRLVVDNEASVASVAVFEGKARLIAEDNQYFYMYEGEKSVALTKLTSKPSWGKVCEVRVHPETDQLPNSGLAIQEVFGLLSAQVEFLHGAGRSCGSLQTRGRWAGAMWSTFTNGLHRPWSIGDVSSNPKGGAPYRNASYEDDLENLALWALQGVSEWTTYRALVESIEDTREKYAAYLIAEFNLSALEAEERSKVVIEAAVDRGLGFYRYRPFANDEAELRRAILLGESLEHIQSLDIASVLERYSEKKGQYRDSILNIAIDRPDVLSYLISSGAAPGQPNRFGKTPLMYAAQRNAQHATKLLLAAGADPNARTFTDALTGGCEINLGTADMTPLHYAARYATAAVIELLVANGAQTYTPSRSVYWDAETPLDWFEHFNSTERSSPLSRIEVGHLRSILQPPAEEKRRQIAQKLNLSAEEIYRTGDYEKAYSTLKQGLSADPNNTRILKNMSLVGFKAGYKLEAARASRTLLKMDLDSESNAVAHFNLGLACEPSPGSISSISYIRDIGGVNLCADAFVHFLTAAKLSPSQSRRNTVLERIDELGCRSNQGDHKLLAHWYRGTIGEDPRHLGLLVVQRPKSVHPASVLATPRYEDDDVQVATLVETMIWEDHALELWQTPGYINSLSINGKPCS